MDTKKMLFFGKAKGSVYLVVVLVTVIILSVMAMSAAKVNQVAMDSFGSTKKMLQAQQYAASEAEVLRLTDYSNVAAHAKTDIADSDGYKSEVLLSAETVRTDNFKEKTATVNIYKDSEFSPRYTLLVPISDAAKLAVGLQAVTGMVADISDTVSLTANGSYGSVTVIVSSKFTPKDNSWTGFADFSIAAAGSTGTVGTTTSTTKSGSKGHYWGTTQNVVNQKTLAADISLGDIVTVALTGAANHSGTTVTILLGTGGYDAGGDDDDSGDSGGSGDSADSGDSGDSDDSGNDEDDFGGIFGVRVEV